MREPNDLQYWIEEPTEKRPHPTCPTIDGIIKDLEIVRKANGDLWDNAEFWEARAREYFKLATQWQDYAKWLASQMEQS
jgi:hypothetical protein